MVHPGEPNVVRVPRKMLEAILTEPTKYRVVGGILEHVEVCSHTLDISTLKVDDLLFAYTSKLHIRLLTALSLGVEAKFKTTNTEHPELLNLDQIRYLLLEILNK